MEEDVSKDIGFNASCLGALDRVLWTSTPFVVHSSVGPCHCGTYVCFGGNPPLFGCSSHCTEI